MLNVGINIAHDETFQSYSSFTSNFKPPQEYEELLVAASKLHSKTAKGYEYRDPYETSLVGFRPSPIFSVLSTSFDVHRPKQDIHSQHTTTISPTNDVPKSLTSRFWQEYTNVLSRRLPNGDSVVKRVQKLH